MPDDRKGGLEFYLPRNHDNPRAVTRFTDDSDEYRELGAKLPCMEHMTLGGTMYIYRERSWECETFY